MLFRSPVCGRKIEKQSPSEITDRLLAGFPDKRAILLAPVVRGRKGEYRKLFADLRREGFARVRVDGTLYELEEAEKLKLEKFEKHDVDVVIDRVTLREGDRSRIAESVELGLRRGESLSQAYYKALLFTGRVVVLTGITLGVAVATWALSPIQFQADMGVLLAFMFVWNMLGALILLPALGHFLLRPARVGEPATQLQAGAHPA